MSSAVPVAILALVVALAFTGMWWGWRRRSAKHDLPPLPQPSGAPASRGAAGRYFGTTADGAWLDRVVARGLGARSDCTLALTDEGLVVGRPGREDFVIPVTAIVGARRDRGIAGKVIPPDGMLVVTWRHGGQTLDSGFRLDDGGHDSWIGEIEHLVKEHTQ